MPRKARVLLPNYPHHIVQRGHNRNTVFVADEDYQYYLDNLCEWKEKLGIKLFAWCLMTNHIHLLVEPGNDARDLSELMKRLAGRQTAYVNKLEKRSGSLWEGRFKISPVQRDEYLLACCRYIELNPVRAKMVEHPRHYIWSSYNERMGIKDAHMLDLDCMYLGLAATKSLRIERYNNYISEAISAHEMVFLKQAYSRNQLTGNARFIDEVERRIGLRIEARGRGKPKRYN